MVGTKGTVQYFVFSNDLGYQPPLKNTDPRLFLAKRPPPKLAKTVQAPLFRQSPLYTGFS